MGSAIWSTPHKDMLNFPALNFLNFFKNHGLLTINDRPQWKTIIGGSKTYIDKNVFNMGKRKHFYKYTC